MARGFEAKACRVDEVIAAEREMNRVLLDSGATRPVIPYKRGVIRSRESFCYVGW